MATFEHVNLFEEKIADFFGSPYAVATDCCTHAIELCLRLKKIKYTSCPTHTYLSIPMTLYKLGIPFSWDSSPWENYYQFANTNIIDAAAYWQNNGYVDNSLMCISFQYKKHLSLNRGGIILCSSKDEKDTLEMMSHDGRKRGTDWANQNIAVLGYHYYMTPETAVEGIDKFEKIKNISATSWNSSFYPNLKGMPIFES